MDARKVAVWVAGIGLATAIVAFGTEMMSTITTLKAAQAKSDQELGILRSTLEARTAENQRLTKELEQQVERQRAQTAITLLETEKFAAQNTRCSQHVDALNGLEGRFSNLRAQNGTMLSMFKSCARGATSEDVAGCSLTVCIGAAFFGGDCVRTLNDASQISSAIRQTRQLAVSDGCSLPSSPTLSFLSN